MKNRQKSLPALLAMLLMIGVVACETPVDEPTPDGEFPAAPNKNTYAINGVEHNFGSTAAMMVDDNLLLVATPESGVKSANAILTECEEYFYGAVSPLLVGQKVDVKSEQDLFTIVSTLVGAPIETLAPEMQNEVESGEFVLSNDNGKVTLMAELVLTGGTKLAVNIEAKESVKVNENIISRGEESKPLRSAFYKEEQGVTTLWVSPAGLDYFEELDIATWYIRLSVSNELMGEKFDVSKLSAESVFSFAVVDNLNSDNNVLIEKGRMSDVEGNCFVEKVADAKYVVVLNLTIGDVLYAVAFDGDCVGHDVAPEKATNFLTYKGSEVKLVGAELDCTSDVWVVSLIAADQSVIVATVPANFFTGDAKGFSQSPNLTVTYNGRTYSKANGDSGTIWASVADGVLNFEFVGYGDLSCVYSGECTIIE